MMVSITLPNDVNTAFGVAASASSLVCLRNSFSSFARVLRDPQKNQELPNSFLQRVTERVLGQAGSTLSSMVRDASEGVFWGITSLACGALAMLALDPKGQRTPAKNLQSTLTIHQGPAVFSEDFATRFNPLNFDASFSGGLGEGVEYLSKSLHSTVKAISRFFFPPKVIAQVAPKIPSWFSPLERLHYETEKSYSLSLPVIALGALNLWQAVQLKKTQASLGHLEGRFNQLREQTRGLASFVVTDGASSTGSDAGGGFTVLYPSGAAASSGRPSPHVLLGDDGTTLGFEPLGGAGGLRSRTGSDASGASGASTPSVYAVAGAGHDSAASSSGGSTGSGVLVNPADYLPAAEAQALMHQLAATPNEQPAQGNGRGWFKLW